MKKEQNITPQGVFLLLIIGFDLLFTIYAAVAHLFPGPLLSLVIGFKVLSILLKNDRVIKLLTLAFINLILISIFVLMFLTHFPHLFLAETEYHYYQSMAIPLAIINVLSLALCRRFFGQSMTRFIKKAINIILILSISALLIELYISSCKIFGIMGAFLIMARLEYPESLQSLFTILLRFCSFG